jgi:hypothetical protein
MSSNDPTSRPTAITALALAICMLGLGQVVCAGLMPSANVIGILSGAVLFTAGLIVWNIKNFWRKESVNAYLNFLTGTIFLFVAINGALGLGIAQYRIPSLFVWIFVAVGLFFVFFGWSLLKTQLPK